MSIQIQDKTIGDSAPCFITFEAGPTHNGLESALALVRIAADAGADAVKFQILDADRLVADRQQLFSYDILLDRKTGKTETIQEPLHSILKRRELSHSEWLQVKEEANKLDILFFATIAFPEEIEFVAKLGADSIKIASSDINHTPLIQQAARTGLCIQIDTGNSTIGEIETAVDSILSTGNNKIIIHHCPSGYPARLPSIQLRMIQTLKQMFPFPVAYSDHTPGWEMDIAATALGANLVEKTITLDRCTRSVEHIFSLEADEPLIFVRSIKDLEIAMGDTRRNFSPEERLKRQATRRSLFLNTDKQAGDPITLSDLDFRRPGFGIPPTELDRVLGRILSRELPAGTHLDWSHFAA